MSSLDFGDINGAELDIPRLMVPQPLLRLMRRKNQMSGAEAWLHRNKDHAWLHPHRVTLYVQENQFAAHLKPVSYFIRCPRFDCSIDELTPHQKVEETKAALRNGQPPPYQVDPQIAAYTANQLWAKWEKPPTPVGQVPSPWPDTVDRADVIEIDEGDWVEYLKSAHKYSKKDTYFCVGPPRFPLYWTCTGMAFLADQELHDHPDSEILDMFARNPELNTRGGVVE